MADDTISIAKGLDEASKMAGDLGEQAKAIIESFKKAGQESFRLGEFAAKAGELGKVAGDKLTVAFTKAVETIKSVAGLFGEFTTAAESATSTIQGLFDETVSSFDKMQLHGTDLALALEPMVGLIDKNITGMGRLGDAGYEAGSKITTAFKAVEPLLAGILGGSNSVGVKLITAMTEGSSRVIGMERELIGFAVAQGRVSDISEDAGHRFKNLNAEYRSFTEMTSQAAQATGQTIGSVMDLGKSLSTIPGATANGTAIIEVSRLATAVGREQAEVAAQASEMYTKFGTSIHDATQAIAYIQDKAGDSNLRMKDFNATVMEISSSFKMLGDNTLATTNFVSAFDKAFDGSKISPAALKEVITSVGEGVERMSVAQKAFVSGSTGGPGGLAGAFQMDYAIQQGHADEVIKNTMLAMQKQFGGQAPITLKEVNENPALAGEFYKQVQYLTQVSGIAKDDKQAYRVLEAMKSGITDMLKPGAASGEKEDAMSRQMDKGFDLQKQTQTTLMSIYQTMEKARLRQDDLYHAMLIQNPKVVDRVSSIMGVAGERNQEQGMRQAEERSTHSGILGRQGEVGFEEHQVVAPNTGVNDLMSKLGISKLAERAGTAVGALNIHSGKTIAHEMPKTAEEHRSIAPSMAHGARPESGAALPDHTIELRKRLGLTSDVAGHNPPILPTAPRAGRELGIQPVSVTGKLKIELTGDMFKVPIEREVPIDHEQQTARRMATGLPH